MRPFSAAVLVGGASRRMGRDKALVAVGGVPMAARVAAALAEAGADEVVLVGGDDRGLGTRHVADLHPGDGPLGGVLTALASLDAEFVVVVACDLPWLDADTVRVVVDGPPDADVVFARTERREPLCARWRRATSMSALEAAFAAGERAVHRAVTVLRVADVDVASAALTNVNTPADLQAGPVARPPAHGPEPDRTGDSG